MKLPSFLVSAALIFTFAASASMPAAASTPMTYSQLITQAQSLQRDDEKLAAFIDYYKASQIAPTGTEAVAELTKALHDGLPVRIPQFVFSEPVNPAGPLKLDVYFDGQLLAIAPRAGESAAVNDPQNNWPFTRVTYFYRPSTKPDGDWECYAVVHSQLAEDQELGVRMGRLLYLLRVALVENTGQNPLTDGEPFGVWLARHAGDAPGAQEWHNNIYFYDVTRQRSNIEWIREVAHEFSHLALPAIGGDYSDPEAWANGYYGERLLVRWLARGSAGGPKAVIAGFGWPFYGYSNFQKLLIDPYLADFNKTGLSRAALGRHDGEGMRYLIGMLLAVDDHAGPKILGEMLWNLPQTAQVDPLLLYTPAANALALPAVAPVPLSPDIAAPKPSPAPSAPASATAPPAKPTPQPTPPTKPTVTPAAPKPTPPSAPAKPAPPTPAKPVAPPAPAPPTRAPIPPPQMAPAGDGVATDIQVFENRK